MVEEGERINIEKDLYFEILWPSFNKVVDVNSLNNNSLVCKLNYKNFSMLFTGDIENQTERILVSKYKNTNILNSEILKVGHHGSKTSSNEEFLALIKPKIALIGVEKNNKFGHPNLEVLERLNKFNCKVYRTDNNGEISIIIKDKDRIKVNKVIE